MTCLCADDWPPVLGGARLELAYSKSSASLGIERPTHRAVDFRTVAYLTEDDTESPATKP